MSNDSPHPPYTTYQQYMQLQRRRHMCIVFVDENCVKEQGKFVAQ